MDDDVDVAGQFRHVAEVPFDDRDAAGDLPLRFLLAHAFAPRGEAGFPEEFADA